MTPPDSLRREAERVVEEVLVAIYGDAIARSETELYRDEWIGAILYALTHICQQAQAEERERWKGMRDEIERHIALCRIQKISPCHWCEDCVENFDAALCQPPPPETP